MFSHQAVKFTDGGSMKSWKAPNRNISYQLNTLAKQIILMRDKHIAKMGPIIELICSTKSLRAGSHRVENSTLI